MGGITLGRDDLRRVDRAIQVLACPLDFHDLSQWRREVNRVVGDLLAADQKTFYFSLEGEAPFVSEEIPASSLKKYGEIVLALDVRLALFERVRRAKVSNRRTTWGPHLDYFYRSPYYNEFLVPLRAFDNLTAYVDLGSPSRNAQLLLNHERSRGRRFGGRGRDLLRLVYPALEAGCRTAAGAHAWRDDLAGALDGLTEGVLLFTWLGRMVHRNPAAARLLDDPTSGERVRAAVHRVLGAVRTLRPSLRRDLIDKGSPGSIAETVETNAGPISVAGSRMGPHVFGPGATISVTLAPPEPLGELERRAQRFGLTRRQAQVAALLAMRMSNLEIASALGISSHTARHHTERVLLKLQCQDRRHVASVIGGEARPDRPEGRLRAQERSPD